MRRIAAVAFAVFVAVPPAMAQEPGFILDPSAESHRQTILQALDILARRCSEIRLTQPKIGVRLHPDPRLSIAPNRSTFGWAQMIEVAAPPYTFSLGGGSRPGIASLSGLGHKGAELCGAPEQHGEWAFYPLPEMAILDRLGGPTPADVILDTFRKK